MDNPQHYQPLSHALHHPSAGTNHYTATSHHVPYSQPQPHKAPVNQRNAHLEEEEEEDEDDEDDEGLVEEQLNQNDADIHGSDPSSPKPTGYVQINQLFPFSLLTNAWQLN